MIPTLDSNILVYTVDERDRGRQSAAQVLTAALTARNGPLGLQVCGEFYRAVTRRMLRQPWEAAQAARNLMVSFRVFPATMRSTERALAAAAARRFSFWDANLLSAAEEAGCTHLISEDMQDGARLGRVEVVKAFEAGEVSIRARELLGL